MSRAPALSRQSVVASRSAVRRGSYLEQLLTEHMTNLPAPAATPAAPSPLVKPLAQPGARLETHDTPVRAGTRSRTDDDTEAETTEDTCATEAADSIAACARTALSPLSREPTDWAAFGTVIPVLAGHTGGGASVLAAVLADALAAQGHQVLLIDTADPLRSGLVDATTDDGPSLAGPHRSIRLRRSRRGPIRCTRLEFDATAVRTPSMVPAPQYWTIPDGRVDVTVVDLGWDAWALAATALQGPGGWLRCDSPAPRPMLALRPNLPAARHTEQLLNRLAPWAQDGAAADIAAVAVMGAKRLPDALWAAAGPLLTPLLGAAMCVPENRCVAERGITADPTPMAAQQATYPLLSRWGLLAATTTPPVSRRSRLRRKPPRQEGSTP